MSDRHIVRILFAGIFLCGSGLAMAEEHNEGGKWAEPNVVGSPGYKEPSKSKDGAASSPIPVQPAEPSSGSYHYRRSTEGAPGSNR